MNHSSGVPPQREATTLLILSIFFIILGALVLLGTLWTLDDFRASVVNVGSGLVLAAVGVGMMLISRRLAHSSPPSEDESTTDG